MDNGSKILDFFFFIALIVILPVLKVNSNDTRHFQILIGIK